MDIHKAKELIIMSYNNSNFRESTKQEMKQLLQIKKTYGDDFAQSCYVQAATVSLQNSKLKGI